jgi:hypothetical protein
MFKGIKGTVALTAYVCKSTGDALRARYAHGS